MCNPNKRPTRTLLAGATLLVGLAALTVRADYATTVTLLGPLAYWRFDETNASPPLNKTTNASSMGSILDGYAVADALLGEPGRVGKCVRITNPGSADAGYCNGKVDVPFNAALNKTGAFSFELWMKPNSLGDTAGMCILSSMMNEPVDTARNGYLIYVDVTGRIEFRQGNSLGYVGVVDTGSAGGAAVVGEWRHVVCTFDGLVSRIYVSGQLAATLPFQAGELASLGRNTTMPFRIGGTPFRGRTTTDPQGIEDIPWPSFTSITGNRGFDGWVDEVAYYGYALNSNTVAAHFAAASTNNAGYAAQILADNPVGYWGLNENAATPPSQESLPIAVNSGALGPALNGTNMWGVLTAQPGPPGAGFGAGNKAILNDGVSGGYLGLPNDAGLNISGNITLMAWIKPTDKNYYRDIIAHGWPIPVAGQGTGPTDFNETFLRISRAPEYGGGTFYEVGATDGGGATYYDAARFPMPPDDIGK